MPFELGIQVWKIMSFRWRPSSWMQFSILRLKSSIAQANSCWSIVSTSCRMASFNSFKLRGLWVYTLPFSTLRGRNHMMTSQETLRAMAHRRNAKWGAQGTCFEESSLVSWLVIIWFLPLGVPEEPCVHSQSAKCHGPQGLLIAIMWLLPLGVPEKPCVHSQSAMCHSPQGLLIVIMWFLPLGLPEGPRVHSQSAMFHGPQGLLNVIMWFLPLGVPEEPCVHSQTP